MTSPASMQNGNGAHVKIPRSACLRGLAAVTCDWRQHKSAMNEAGTTRLALSTCGEGEWLHCWWAASPSTRHRRSFKPSVRRSHNICSRCPTAKSARAVTGSAVSTIRCWPRIPSSRWCSVQRPAPDENGIERQFPRRPADAWWFKVKEGVTRVRFGDPGWRLGYARDAINSYFVFNVMKEKASCRRTCASRSRSRWSTACCRRESSEPRRPRQDPPGYEAATRAEIAKIVEKILRASLPSSGIARPRCRTHMALFPAFRSRARSSAICRRCAISRRTSPRTSRSVITSASERSAAGALCTRRSRPGSEACQCLRGGVRPAGRLDPRSGARPQRRRVLRATQGARTARGASLSRPHSQHGAAEGAHRHRPQISPRVRPGRLLRLRATAGVGAAEYPAADHHKAVEIAAPH